MDQSIPQHNNLNEFIFVSRVIKGRMRLNARVLAILEGFYGSVSRNPTMQQMRDLVKQVKDVPGYVDYDLPRLKAWFIRKRKIDAQIDSTSNSPISKTAGPSQHISAKSETGELSEADIRRLGVLAANTSNPSPELIAMWAELLHRPESLIQAWITDKYSGWSQHQGSHPPMSPIPTDMHASESPITPNLLSIARPLHVLSTPPTCAQLPMLSSSASSTASTPSPSAPSSPFPVSRPAFPPRAPLKLPSISGVRQQIHAQSQGTDLRRALANVARVSSSPITISSGTNPTHTEGTPRTVQQFGEMYPSEETLKGLLAGLAAMHR